MSDDLTDSAKAYVLTGLKNLVLTEIRGGRTRDEIVHVLHKRGLKLETARAFLRTIESMTPGLSEVIDRKQEEALLRRLRAVVRATYHE